MRNQKARGAIPTCAEITYTEITCTESNYQEIRLFRMVVGAVCELAFNKSAVCIASPLIHYSPLEISRKRKPEAPSTKHEAPTTSTKHENQVALCVVQMSAISDAVGYQ